MNPKDLRKQIRNVLQEMGKELLASEAGVIIKKDVIEQMDARLDEIDKYCQQSLEKQDKRARGVQSFVLGEVTGKIQNDLFNANITIDAVAEVLADAGLGIENFAEKIDAKKTVIAERKKKEADDQMQAEMIAREEARKAAIEAATQQPAVQPEQTA